MIKKNLWSKENKLAWLEEEVRFLSSRIFNPLDIIEDATIELTKAEEKTLLNKFNEVVLYTAEATEHQSNLILF